jgi:hypothetical protein
MTLHPDPSEFSYLFYQCESLRKSVFLTVAIRGLLVHISGTLGRWEIFRKTPPPQGHRVVKWDWAAICFRS